MENLTIREFRRRFLAGELSSAGVTADLLARIRAVDPVVGAYLTLDEAGALAAAEQADRQREQGLDLVRRPLAGVPLAVKDNMCTRGLRTTCASRILEGFVPPYDATVVERLRAAGAVILGKTNMDEFAMGSSTENSAFGLTRNPWDTRCIPGGSSGGSAAAVAANECLGALGSDTGGSIRQPAACCGVVGLKPTYGLVSRYGLVAFASSLDQIGPLGKTVGDAALLLSVIAGHDRRDSTSVNLPVPDYAAALDGRPAGRKGDGAGSVPQIGLAGLRLGIPREYFQEGLDHEVAAAVRVSLDLLRELGASVREISLPHTGYAVATYYLLATAEASSNLARYDGVKYGFRAARAGDLMEMYRRTRAEGFGHEVKRRIMLGTYALSAGYYDAYYRKAQKVRTLIKGDFDRAFAEVDLIVTPTAPTPAFRIGEKTGDPLQMYLSDIYTIPVNLAGIPALSLPCGLSRSGLPIGLQILGRAFEETRLLSAAHAFETARGLGLPDPPLREGGTP